MRYSPEKIWVIHKYNEIISVFTNQKECDEAIEKFEKLGHKVKGDTLIAFNQKVIKNC